MAVMTLLTWRKWADILVDFGLQLYLPWKLSTGAVLYRDVAYLPGGPLSQYYHALLFKVFGVSLTSIVVSNLVITSVLLLVVYRSFRAISDRLTAVAACLSIVLVFAFGYYSDLGNYNFITPYSAEAVHGLVLSIAAVALAAKWVVKNGRATAMGIGLCSGLTFLTKPEIFLALVVCLGAALVLRWFRTKQVREIATSAAAMAGAGVVPIFGFFLFFLRVGDVQSSVKAVAWPWVQLLTTSAAHNPFYMWVLGLNAPGYYICMMLAHLAGLAISLTVLALVLRRSMEVSFNRIMLVALLAVFIGLASDFGWGDCGYALPPLCAALLVLLLHRTKQGGVDSAMVLPLLWTVFSIMMLAKLGFFCRIWHYGFVLALPAFLSAIYLLLWVVPPLLARYGVRTNLFRVVICLLLGVAAARLVMQSLYLYDKKVIPVAQAGDRLWTFQSKFSPSGAAMAEALRWLEENTPTDSTLAVLPEGIALNYFSRRTNPSGYATWNPPELAAFGQRKMTEKFCQNSPDYVVLIHRDNSEYGEHYFGQEERFGKPVMDWIRRNYDPVYQIGAEPLQGPVFGLQILKKKVPATPPAS